MAPAAAVRERSRAPFPYQRWRRRGAGTRAARRRSAASPQSAAANSPVEATARPMGAESVAAGRGAGQWGGGGGGSRCGVVVPVRRALPGEAGCGRPRGFARRWPCSCCRPVAERCATGTARVSAAGPGQRARRGEAVPRRRLPQSGPSARLWGRDAEQPRGCDSPE